MARVLLICMPFFSAKYPSLGLSVLKPALIKEGIGCDVKYFNLLFRKYCQNHLAYESISLKLLLGEWVFGPEVYGREWASTQRGGEEQLRALLASVEEKEPREELVETLISFRRIAGSFIQECMQAVNWNNYEIIGFTSVFSQQIASLALSKEIKKKFPDKIIAFGGANCEGELGLVLLDKFPWIDWVFSGDGDLSFPRAIKSWPDKQSLTGIKGLAFRDNGKIISQGSHQVDNLDLLPLPDFDEYYAAIKNEAPDMDGKVLASLEFSRGCWKGAKSQCAFCGLNGQGLNYRSKSPLRAKEEIELMLNRYGNNRIQVTDNILDTSYFKSLLPELTDKNLKSLFVETRSTLRYQELVALKNAGAKMFQPGIESLDTEILKYIDKDTTLIKNIRFLKWCRELGLFPEWNFLHSFPGENPQAYGRMQELIPKLEHLRPPGKIGTFVLARFSSIYNNPEKWGIKSIKADPVYQCIYPFDQEVRNRLANIFEYIDTARDGQNRENSYYIEPIKSQIKKWQEKWQQGNRPLLAFEREKTNRLTVYDTRTIAKRKITELNDVQSLILSSCELGLSYPKIIGKLREAKNFRCDEELQKEIQSLVEMGFVIIEENKYLSLVNDLSAMVENGQSATAVHLIFDTF